MKPASRRSALHLQMGQETIYMLLAVAIFANIVLAAYLLEMRQRLNAPRQEDPPIIVLPEAGGFSFPAGSAAVSPAFEARLRRQVVPRVRAIGRSYAATVIEVIGHTDDVPRSGGGRLPSNLDRALVPLYRGDPGIEPAATDNAGLGLARAAAVAGAMRRAGLARDFMIVPLSAGPFLRPDDSVTGEGEALPDAQRRRIEVRLRRRTRQ